MEPSFHDDETAIPQYYLYNNMSDASSSQEEEEVAGNNTTQNRIEQKRSVDNQLRTPNRESPPLRAAPEPSAPTDSMYLLNLKTSVDDVDLGRDVLDINAPLRQDMGFRTAVNLRDSSASPPHGRETTPFYFSPGSGGGSSHPSPLPRKSGSRHTAPCDVPGFAHHESLSPHRASSSRHREDDMLGEAAAGPKQLLTDAELQQLQAQLEAEEAAEAEREAALARRRLAEDQEVREYLQQLDRLREACAQSGLFKKAQRCLDRMREVNLRYAHKVQLEAQQVDVGVVRQCKRHQRVELLQLRRTWQARLDTYTSEMAQTLKELEDQQAAQLSLLEASAARQLHPAAAASSYNGSALLATPMQAEDTRHTTTTTTTTTTSTRGQTVAMPASFHYSREVMTLESELERLVQHRLYAEADSLQRQLRQKKKLEEQAFWQRKKASQKETLRQAMLRFEHEYRALEDRLNRGKAALVQEQNEEADLLRRRHHAQLRKIESNIALLRKRASDYIERQVMSYCADPLKFGIELTGLSTLALSAQRSGVTSWGAAGRTGTARE